MTEAEWLTCGSRNQMRSVIKSLPFAPKRWGLFNRACIERVRELLQHPGFARLLRELDEHLGRSHAAIREAVDQLRLLRGDTLYRAKDAAVRAILAADSPTFATSETVATAIGRWRYVAREERRFHCNLLRDIFGNPFRPVAFDPAWRSDTAVSLAKHIYESRDFSAMPILADALQDAGCDNADILKHCRDETQVHVRGCWVVDLVLGKS